MSPGGLALPLSSQDAVWLARACVGEGGGEVDAHAIVSTMIRRWAMLRDLGRGSFGTLTDLVVGRFVGSDPYEGEGRQVAVRGYSQPVAVQWRTGDERRRRVRELHWDAIETWRRAAVLRLLTGRAPLTSAPAVHFAAAEVVEARLDGSRGWRVVEVAGARNVFVSTPASRSRDEPFVVPAGAAAVFVGPPARVEPPAAPREAVSALVSRGSRSSALVPAVALAAVVGLGLAVRLRG